MPDAVVACAANFAEGRDPAILDALLRAMNIPGVLLLDDFRSVEANRSIFTVAGPPAPVCEAAARAAAVAVERMDLTQEVGMHPRIGALDVLPFVPVRGIHLAECAMLARETALMLWERCRLPSYLYAAAATRPDRVELASVRHGQFEGLRDAVRRDSRRRPDVGGPGLHLTAGAAAVGAQRPLVQFKVQLERAHLGRARAMARTLREQFDGVEVAASLMGGCAELLAKVSDFRSTPLPVVYEAMQQAAGAGVAVTACALVGLIPEDAYEPGAAWVQAFDADAERRAVKSLGSGGADGGRVEQCILERRLLAPLSWPSAATAARLHF